MHLLFSYRAPCDKGEPPLSSPFRRTASPPPGKGEAGISRRFPRLTSGRDGKDDTSAPPYDKKNPTGRRFHYNASLSQSPHGTKTLILDAEYRPQSAIQSAGSASRQSEKFPCDSPKQQDKGSAKQGRATETEHAPVDSTNSKNRDTPRGLTKTQSSTSKGPPPKVRQSRQNTRIREQSAEGGIQMVETKTTQGDSPNPTNSKNRRHAERIDKTSKLQEQGATPKSPAKPAEHPNPRAERRREESKKVEVKATRKNSTNPTGGQGPQHYEGARQNIARRPVLRDRPPRLSFPETYSSTSSRRR